MRFRTALAAMLLAASLITTLMIGASSYWSAKATVDELSSQILEETSERIEQHVSHLLEAADKQGIISRNMLISGQLDPTDQKGLTAYFLEVMRANPELTYLSFGLQENGNYCHVFRDPVDGLTIRFVQRVDDKTFELRDFFPGHAKPHKIKPDHDVDVRVRPYYLAAVEAGEQTWTETYIFIGPEGTLHTPGVTCATPVYRDTELVGVLTADFDVDALSRALQDLAFAGHDGNPRGGLAFIVERRKQQDSLESTKRKRVVIAHPNPKLLIRLIDPAELSKGSDWVPAEEIADARVQGFLTQIPNRDLTDEFPTAVTPVSFTADGERFIGGHKQLQANRQLDWVICMAIPEADVMEGVWVMNRVTTGIGLMSVMLTVLIAIYLSRRVSGPIEQLVRDSDRIRRGNLSVGEDVKSNVAEVRQLADAHDRMREGLQSLLKLEHDLQIARRIQQSTLPVSIPQPGEFQVDAWNEPAEQTGGDTYDVVTTRFSSNRSETVVLLLADATGHGVGPALSVTQVRAMLRMAVRMGADIMSVARHLNQQLLDDLPEGRFISAWLGELDASDHTLTMFSAGQAPLFHYVAARDEVDVLAADTVPLGIVSDLAADVRNPLILGRGDVFVVISDGVIEAINAEDKQFGISRVVDVITANHALSASELMAKLRGAIADFVQTVPSDDDRTAIVIRRRD